MSTCNCGALAEYLDPFNPYSREFCASCFIDYVEKKILKGVPRRVRGHPIAVALSGGKDSLVLLHTLYSYQNKLKLPSLIALILEEEIPEIQQERQKVVQHLQDRLPGLSIKITTYSELYGYTLSDLVAKNDEKNLGFTPCSICGILRKQALFELGKRYGADFILLGTTLEDEAATIILNIIRGIPISKKDERSKIGTTATQKLPQRIKPLARISEELIRTYVQIKGIVTLSNPCPYSDRSLRSEITTFSSLLKARDPQGSFLFNILKTRQELAKKIVHPPETYPCKQCKMISHHVLCHSCRIISKIVGSG